MYSMRETECFTSRQSKFFSPLNFDNNEDILNVFSGDLLLFVNISKELFKKALSL